MVYPCGKVCHDTATDNQDTGGMPAPKRKKLIHAKKASVRSALMLSSILSSKKITFFS